VFLFYEAVRSVQYLLVTTAAADTSDVSFVTSSSALSAWNEQTVVGAVEERAR